MKSPLSNKNVKMIECRLRAVFHSWSPGWGVFWRHGAEGSPRAAPPDNTPAVGVKRAAAAVLAGLITQAFFNIPLTQSRCPRHSRATPLSRCGTHQSVTFHRENQPVAPTSVTLKRFDWLVVGGHIKAWLLFSAEPFSILRTVTAGPPVMSSFAPHTHCRYSMILAIAGFVSLQLHRMSDFVLRKVTWQAFDLN